MADLLVTFDSAHQSKAIEQLKKLLELVGEEQSIQKTEVEGDAIVQVNDPFKTVEKVREEMQKGAEKFSYLSRFIPITVWTEPKVEKMQKAISDQLDKIGEEEKWKMSLEKRGWDEMPSQKLIVKLTEVVDRKNVDLDSPEKIIQVEIVGEKAGVSILKPEQLLEAKKEFH